MVCLSLSLSLSLSYNAIYCYNIEEWCSSLKWCPLPPPSSGLGTAVTHTSKLIQECKLQALIYRHCRNGLAGTQLSYYVHSGTAEQVVHDTELWLSGHQKFNDLDLVHSLISETEVRYGRTMCDTRSKNLFRMSSFWLFFDWSSGKWIGIV